MRISDWSSDVCSSDLKADIRISRDSREGLETAPFLFSILAANLRHRGLACQSFYFKKMTCESLDRRSTLSKVPPCERQSSGHRVWMHKLGRASCRERGCPYG